MDDIQTRAGAIARELKSGGESMSAELRKRFVDLRAELFLRGVYDPVLVRFDSATAPRATVQEIAEELEKIATPAAP